MSMIALWPRTLLPAASSGGAKVPIPNLPGDTAISPPPTPLLAGRPAWNSHFAAVVVEAGRGHHRQDPRHVLGSITCFLVSGFLPPLARVAAMLPRSLALTAIAHWRV